MKEFLKKLLRPVLFTAGGALVGLGYYYLVGCSTGTCAITSNPYITVLYSVLLGFLRSGAFGWWCGGSCKVESKSDSE